MVEVQKSWKLAVHEETWDHVSTVPTHPVGGPGNRVRAKGASSEKANFGWG